MIASLAGTVGRLAPGEVVVDVGGVGYRVRVSAGTYADLPADGDPCRLRVVTVVREDEISLYGFLAADEEALFRSLQAVSGVGPRLALRVLSGMKTSDLRRAVTRGDLRALTSISGVGKKLAERLVVELRDKVEPVEAGAPVDHGAAGEALQALEALGYPRPTARRALDRARDGGAAAVEDLVREALRILAPRRPPGAG